MRDTQQAAADAFGARERDDRGGDCEEAIAERLAGGPRKSRDVKSEVAEELGCSARTVERAAARMAGRDELAITEGGFPRTTTWHLLAPSGDTPIANDVATGVATDGTPVVEPNQSSCDTSGDTDGNGCVATGGLAPPDWRDEFRRRHGAQR